MIKQNQLSNLLLDQNKDLIWMINHEFQLIYANKSYLSLMIEVTGAEKKMKDSVFVEGFGEGYIAKWKSHYIRALKGEYFEIEEHFFNPKTNEIQYGQTTFEPLRGDDNEIFAVACQSKNITRIVKQRSDANQLIDASLDVFCTVNEKGDFVYVSAAATNLWGYLPEELIGKSYVSFILEEDVPKTNEIAAAILSGRDVKSFVNRYKKKDGGIAYNIWSVRWDEGTKLMYGVARDGKEKIEQEEKIQQSEQRFKALVQDGSDLVAILDVEGKYMYVSPTHTAILGVAPEELIGKNAFEFIHPDDLERTSGILQRMGSENRVLVEPFRLQNHKKEWRWIETLLTNMLDNPAVEGIVTNSRDITEEKKLRELHHQAVRLSKIGSWEMDLINPNEDTNYWSPMVKEILEVDDNYIPTITGGIEFFIGESKERIKKALDLLIKYGFGFDEELLLLTGKGNERWIRCIGKSENVNYKRTKIYGSFQDINERKKSEINLAESENRLRTILEAEPECIKLLGPKGEILMMNPAGLEMIEADNEEQVIGKSVLGILLLEHRSAFLKLTKNVFKGESGKLLFEIKGLKGTHRWLETHAVPMKNEQGDIISLLGVTRDITERKKAEQEKNNLQATLESSLNEIYIFDAETLQFTYVNKGALLNLGYSVHEIKTITPLDLKPNFTAISFKQLVTPLVNNEKEKIIFFTNHKRKNGSLYPVEIHLQLVTEGNNKRFLAIILDITERKKAEEENRFKANLLSKMGQAAIATNLDGVVNYWNKAAENIYGWTLEEAIGNNIMHLTTPEANKGQAKQIMEMLNKGQRWSGKFNVRKKGGTKFLALVTNSPIYDENNILSGIIGVSSDITQEAKNEELIKQYMLELERSNEELEQFAFIASHDLQEPLRMISSFMDQLTRKYGDLLDEKAHQYIHFATDGANRMKQIILDLLEYSRATRPTEGTEEVDMNEILSEFKQLRRKLIFEKSASIKSNDLPTLNTYKAAITQILHCILDNALKYATETTPAIVEIKAVENEKEWEFSIKDNGIGIAPQFYDKIFIIFQRLHNKDEYAGTGIGLSIAKRHVELLRGRIWLESAVDKGSVFYFTIPKSK